MSSTTAKVLGLLSFKDALPNPGQRKQVSCRRQGTPLWGVVHPGLEPLGFLLLHRGEPERLYLTPGSPSASSG